jgi:two-component system cell cycle sensor histidine kinase/response regulator CckA
MVTAVKPDARIMVVDDDPALLGFTCKYLSRLGYTVVPYRSSEEAWKQFQTSGAGFSLGLIDQSMPGISGEQLSRMMLSVNPEIRLIITSGYPVDPQSLLETTPDRIAFLLKPFTPAMLAETVNRLVRASPNEDAD